MKVAIITDQHFGARKNSKQFHDYFLKFYNDVFFPTLEKHKIKTVVDMGGSDLNAFRLNNEHTARSTKSRRWQLRGKLAVKIL